MTMRHATEAELVRAADGSLDAAELAALNAHFASCAACRAELDAQTAARRVLAARPIEPVRDLSAAIRATLETERPWIERLNWRRLSLRVAPIAAALTLAALFLVRTADTNASAQAATAAATGHSVASALWSGEVTDDQLLTLVLSARPDDALSTYVQEK
jgi:anti-sigma factor RsiW